MARPRNTPTRIKARTQKGKTVYYLDARCYGRVGGRFEALKEEGTQLATTDHDVAVRLAAKRLEELRQLQAGHHLPGVSVRFSLAEGIKAHLARQQADGDVSVEWLDQAARHLARAIAFFGKDCDPAAISADDVASWDAELKETPNGRMRDGKPTMLSPQSRRHHLNSLSLFYRFLNEKRAITAGLNPVKALKKKPTVKPRKPRFLQVTEAGLLIHAAGHPDCTCDGGIRFVQELVATYLYTGMRESELYQCCVEDFDFDREIIEVREREAVPDGHGRFRLKNEGSQRTLRFAPMLQAILKPYFARCGQSSNQLAFPSPNGRDILLTDTRKLLERVATKAHALAPTAALKAAFADPKVWRTKTFRHTYCTTRLQTLDHGKPIAPFTVSREMGHASLDMVDKVYGHLGTIRRRSADVEYPCPSLRP